MSSVPKSKGPWITRFVIRFLTVAFGLLIFWLLGFLLEDIASIEGPRYEAIEAQYLEPALVESGKTRDQQEVELGRQIENQTEAQRLIGASSQNLQQTISQLLELQKIGLEKNIGLSDKEQANVTGSLNLFLENQRKYQELSQNLSDLLHQKQELEKSRQELAQQIEAERQPARAHFEKLTEAHRLRLALLQLAVLLPLMAVAALLTIKRRTSIYFPFYLAFGGATLLKIGLVIHAYFPSRYIKYVLIMGLLLAVGRMLFYFIRALAFPKASWLLQQYREAYERFLCPVCEYPIRTGPRRFLYWTRRTVNKLILPSGSSEGEETYACPACGTKLFEECPACRKVRHSLLPHCDHCSAEKTIAASAILK